MVSLNEAVVCFGTAVIITAFIVSLIYSKKNKGYMKGFFIVILISLTLSINTIFNTFFRIYDLKLNYFIQSILLLADLLFWTYFFLKLLDDKKNNILIKILSAISILFSIWLLYYNSTDKSNLQILVVLNVCKTIFCILFYRTLFKNLTSQNILSESAFWIVNGLIFYSSLSLPFYGLNHYIRLQFSTSLSNNIFSISNMLITIMYLFFIKAYLCKIHLHKA